MEQQLLPEPASVRVARQAVGDTLRGADYQGDIGVALLLTSEVVTNAVRHAIAPITLFVRANRTEACVRVTDGDPSRVPVARAVDANRDTSGRGLHILDQMSQDWGYDADAHSKTVWFRVA